MATRQPFSAQATLYILLDYAEENIADIEAISEALASTLTVAAGVVGGIRLPGVGMGVLGPPFTRFLRLSPVRNNLLPVLAGVERLRTELRPSPGVVDMNEVVGAALDAIIGDASSYPLAKSHPTQLVVLTWGEVRHLTEVFTRVLTNDHGRFINAVQVIGLESVLQSRSQDDLPTGDAAGCIWVTGASYPADIFTLSCLFKSWLVETSGESPHVNLKFPANKGDEKDQEGIHTLLLDMQELMIDFVSLPSTVSSRLTVHHNLYRTVSTTQGQNVSVVDLEILKRVTCKNLASAIFGHAVYLMPTQASSLSFNEIWENKQSVAALSEQLASKKEALLAQVPPSTSGVPNTQLTAKVVILPAGHCGALTMVHVAPAELLLPERNLDGCPDIPEKIRKGIEDGLSSLECTDLQLEDQTSALVPTLIHHLTKSARGQGVVAPRVVGCNNRAAAPPSETVSRVRPQHPAFYGRGTTNRGSRYLGQRAIQNHVRHQSRFT